MKRWLALLLASAFTVLAPAALAQTHVAVTGSVLSYVSASQSSFVADVQTLPADGSTRVTLTATLEDQGNNPIPNSAVKVSSNRGSVDTILCYQGSTLTSLDHTTADINGIAKCVVTSLAPGQAAFTALIDDQVTLNDKPIVTFTALPILQNLTVSVTLPGGAKLTIFKPTRSAPATPALPNAGTELSHKSGTGQLINTGINVEITFWSFLLVLAFLILTPLLFIWIILLIRRVRKLLFAEKTRQLQEQQSLNKIVQMEQQITQKTETISQNTEAIGDVVGAETTPVPTSPAAVEPSSTNPPPPDLRHPD